MDNLTKLNLVNVIINFAKSGKPMLGICLGMQLLFENSNEFLAREGLGIIKGEVKLRLKFKILKNSSCRINNLRL